MELSILDNSFERKNLGLWKYLLTMQNVHALYSYIIVSHETSCHKVSVLVLSDVRFQTRLRLFSRFAKKFEIEYRVFFLKIRNSDIAAGLQASDFLEGGSTTSCLWHICTEKVLFAVP